MALKERADLLLEARWLLPVAPANTVLAHHALAVTDGRIVALGPAAELRARFEAREHLVRPRHALLPGLVNAHTSAWHALLRRVPVQGPRARWLSERLAPLEARCLSADCVRDGTRLGIAEMLRGGVTAFADLSLYPEEAARAAAALHVRCAVGLPVTDGATAWAENASAGLARAARLWDEYRSDARITLYFAPLPRHGLSEPTLARLRRVADELEARVSVQLEDLATEGGGAYVMAAPPDEGGRELGVADAAPAAAPLERLHALQLLRPGFTAVGYAGCSSEALALAARHGVSFVLCPQAQQRLGGALPRGLPKEAHTGLGTDTPLAAGSLDMLAELRSAALAGLTAAEALRAATLGGASALGLGAETGSLEAGKAADLTCIGLGARAEDAAELIFDAIAFATARTQVSDVWVAGRTAVSDGRLRVCDETELAELPRRWAARLNLEAAA